MAVNTHEVTIKVRAQHAADSTETIANSTLVLEEIYVNGKEIDMRVAPSGAEKTTLLAAIKAGLVAWEDG